jgi:hypothetical protein
LAGALLIGTLAGAPAAFAQAPATGPHVEDPGKLPEPPASAPDEAYDARLRASAEAAEQFQGPLDGSWILSLKGQGDRYAFELTDTGTALEGAWRDLRRPGDPAASGVIDQLKRTPAGLDIRFTPVGEPPVEVTLRPDLHGRLKQDGRREDVAMSRSGPPPQGEVSAKPMEGVSAQMLQLRAGSQPSERKPPQPVRGGSP